VLSVSGKECYELQVMGLKTVTGCELSSPRHKEQGSRIKEKGTNKYLGYWDKESRKAGMLE